MKTSAPPKKKVKRAKPTRAQREYAKRAELEQWDKAMGYGQTDEF